MSHGINSYHETAEFLIVFAKNQKLDDTGRTALFAVMDSVHSYYERAACWKSILGLAGPDRRAGAGRISSRLAG